jgi:hypothetical protein
MYIEHIFFLKYWDDDILDNIVNEKKNNLKTTKI